MEIRRIREEKKDYLELLLLADEQESMIDRYLERGTLYVLFGEKPLGAEREDGCIEKRDAVCPGSGSRALAVCVVTDEGGGVLEIKNLAVDPDFQGRGYGRRMVEFIKNTYRGRFHTLLVGTGDSPLTVPFYEACGFVRSHVVKQFFTEHYDHPIYEAGRLLTDMVCLAQPIPDGGEKP